MNDLRTVINNIISGLYELADVLEEQQKIVNGRVNFIEDKSCKHSNALRGIVDVINSELN